MAKFKVGDRVEVVYPHDGMEKGDKGTITLVSSQTPYGVKMDGMTATHYWYVDMELKAADE